MMSTIDSKDIIKTILENNGQYPGDPQCYSVWSYENDWGAGTYKVCMKRRDEDSFLKSPYIKLPQLLWHDGQLTSSGKEILNAD